MLRAVPDAYLLIVGEGSRRDALEAQARELRIAHRVVFTGRRDDVPAVTAALDVAVLPSYREAQGLTILEAMALSRPVVASNVGGIPEMIEDGVTGLLVPPHDADALAAAIVRLLTDHPLADMLGRAGHDLVHDRFCIELMVERRRRRSTTRAPASLRPSEVAAAWPGVRTIGPVRGGTGRSLASARDHAAPLGVPCHRAAGPGRAHREPVERRPDLPAAGRRGDPRPVARSRRSTRGRSRRSGCRGPTSSGARRSSSRPSTSSGLDGPRPVPGRADRAHLRVPVPHRAAARTRRARRRVAHARRVPRLGRRRSALRPQLFGMALFAVVLLLVTDRRAHPGRLWVDPGHRAGLGQHPRLLLPRAGRPRTGLAGGSARPRPERRTRPARRRRVGRGGVRDAVRARGLGLRARSVDEPATSPQRITRVAADRRSATCPGSCSSRRRWPWSR